MLQDGEQNSVWVVVRTKRADEEFTLVVATHDRVYAQFLASDNDGKSGESWSCAEVPLRTPDDPRLDSDWRRLRALAQPRTTAERDATDTFESVRHMASIVAKLYRPDGQGDA